MVLSSNLNHSKDEYFFLFVVAAFFFLILLHFIVEPMVSYAPCDIDRSSSASNK